VHARPARDATDNRARFTRRAGEGRHGRGHSGPPDRPARSLDQAGCPRVRKVCPINSGRGELAAPSTRGPPHCTEAPRIRPAPMALRRAAVGARTVGPTGIHHTVGNPRPCPSRSSRDAEPGKDHRQRGGDRDVADQQPGARSQAQRRVLIVVRPAFSRRRAQRESRLPSVLSEASRTSRAPSLHGHYPASSLLRTHPSPSRRPPISHPWL